ncbi:MAG: putative molybdenum carrier protein [Methylococcales bacterium]
MKREVCANYGSNRYNGEQSHVQRQAESPVQSVWTAICVISGGQTGVDRAALDAALDFGLRIGGWCPKGRRAEDGRIPERYALHETESMDYAIRTKLNVRYSDASLILIRKTLQGGTLLTRRYAEMYRKEFWITALEPNREMQNVADWLKRNAVHRLNVAGPREGNAPGIYTQSYKWLQQLFEIWTLNQH